MSDCKNCGVSYKLEDTECRGCGIDFPEVVRERRITMLRVANVDMRTKELKSYNRGYTHGRNDMLNDVVDILESFKTQVRYVKLINVTNTDVMPDFVKYLKEELKKKFCV